ncbi:serpin family protein [Haladaptatus sp. T7]|uniref:serpin family protein n=1 Tax=Haladaptatus sp. T7 TaxID=2029368 RepID=UPI0021A2599D|nr:serpin family protein [Haladaptatus sp. T7]GKZ16397.1 serine/threonine protein kinase [Haladaptatus sp. T7]
MPPTRRRVLALSNALVAGTLLSGCLAPLSSNDPGTNVQTVTGTGKSNPVSTDEAAIRTLARGNSEFGLTLLSSLAETDPNENQFLSPFSVSVALAMTYAGARGEMRAAMADTLRFPFDGESLHAAFGETDERLKTVDERADADANRGTPFQLTTANAIWGQEGYPWRDDFLTTLRTYYDAGLNVCDFQENADEATETINAWVADRTEGKITDLLAENALDARTRLVLTNAIYFRATWASTFSEENTKRRPFTALDGTTSRVPMMSQSDSFPYAAVDGQQLIELPYVGNEVGMVVLLPKNGTFEAFTSSLSADRLEALLGEMERTDGSITLPKFSLESSLDLGTTLSDLGMSRAFSLSADFGGMADIEETGENLSIDSVRQKSVIEVDEDGTEAAAATAVEVGVTSAPLNPFEMTVDRPFLFLIRHKPTNTVLFLGRVADPTAGRSD